MFQQAIVAEHRFFFALLPPPQLSRQLTVAADWFRDGGQPVAAERLHLTLFILPDQARPDPALIARLRSAGAAVAAAPVAVMLDYVGGSSRSVALRPQHRNPELADLQQAVAMQCRLADLAARPDHTFQPHVTLGYRAARPFGQRIAPIGWTATEFVLIHSHLGRTRHTVLDRWELAGGDDDQLTLF